MFVVTHALLPVLGAQMAQAVSLKLRKEVLFPEMKSFVAIGVAGAAPDLLSPHLSLADRYSSWTHNIWFLLGVVPVLLLIARYFESPGRWLTVFFLWLGIFLHLAVDACSNGINWLHPLRTDIISIPLIPMKLWFPSDLFLLLSVSLAALLIRVLHLRTAAWPAAPNK